MAGNVLGIMLRICVYKSIRAIAAVKFVVSDSGDILSPNQAPDTMAPAHSANEISKTSAMPISARPSVPTVPHDVPVKTETSAHSKQVAGKNQSGEMSFIP